MRNPISPRPMVSCRSGALALALLAGVASVASGSPTWNPANAVRGGDWAWADAQSFDLPGARVSLQRFQAALPPADAARRLTAAGGQRLSRLQWNGTMLLLSGGESGRHWLAQLRPALRGTDGLVSSLMPLALSDREFDPSRFVPPGARQVVQVSSRSQTPPAMLASFDCPGTPAQVATVVRTALTAGKWLPADAPSPAGVRLAGASGPEPAVASGLPVRWRHPRHGELSVHVAQRPASVAVTFWHRALEQR